MNNSFFISWRYQNSKHKNKLINLIGKFSTISIAIGVMVLIIVLSAMNGFERELNNRILSIVPQIEIYNDSIQKDPPPIDDLDLLISLLQTNQQIKAITPFININGLVENNNKFNLLQIRAINPDDLEKSSNLSKYVLDNAWQKFKQNKKGIIIGAGIAKKLNINLGDWISVIISKSDNNNQVATSESFQIEVVGILQIKGQLDYSYALLHLSHAQEILGYNSKQVSGVEINVGDPFKVNDIRFEQLSKYPTPLMADTWMSKYAYMYNDIQLVKHIMYIAMILVIAIACFNIVSTLVMAVKEKQGDIAIMRTLGASDKFILKIFLYYGLISGMKGCIIGIILGVLISLNLTNIVLIIESIFKVQFISNGIYFVDFLPSELKIYDLLIVFFVALILSLFASLYPAIRAIRLQPSAVLSKF